MAMQSLLVSNIPATRYGALGVEELFGVEIMAFPPETIAGDRSPSVFAVAFGVTPISGVGRDGPAEPAGPIVTFPPLMMAGASLPRVEACSPTDQPLATQATMPDTPTPKAPIASKRSIDALLLGRHRGRFIFYQ
jgi:hypothetical protein